MRDKLERYATYAHQVRLEHLTDDSYRAPLQLFVLPNYQRETWLARLVRDLIAEWVSWQEDLRQAGTILRMRPYPVRIYSTAVAHLAEAQDGPVSDVWLPIVPVPVNAEALEVLEDIGWSPRLWG